MRVRITDEEDGVLRIEFVEEVPEDGVVLRAAVAPLQARGPDATHPCRVVRSWRVGQAPGAGSVQILLDLERPRSPGAASPQGDHDQAERRRREHRLAAVVRAAEARARTLDEAPGGEPPEGDEVGELAWALTEVAASLTCARRALHRVDLELARSGAPLGPPDQGEGGRAVRVRWLADRRLAPADAAQAEAWIEATCAQTGVPEVFRSRVLSAIRSATRPTRAPTPPPGDVADPSRGEGGPP